VSRSLSSSDTEPVLFELFVFSHTHVADAGFRPLQKSPGRWNPLVVNTGAWQRTANSAQFEKLLKSTGLDPKAALAKLKPEDLPACYPVILVPPYKAKPISALRYWVENKMRWSLKTSCE